MPPLVPVATSNDFPSQNLVAVQAMESEWTSHWGWPEDYEPLNQAPSRYLNQKCLLCFPFKAPDVFTQYLGPFSILTGPILTQSYRGSYSGPHCCICLDGCFQHKHCRSAGSGDQVVPKAQTYFLTPQEVLEVHQYSDHLQSSKNPISNDVELSMPSYVYDVCTAQFTAANESKPKAEASIFEDTGLMALTCHHDRVLFMVTLKDPGEKQDNP